VRVKKDESRTVERLKTDLLGELHLMSPPDLRAHWKRVKWPKPNLVKLSKIESSPLAIALRKLPPKVLAQASAQLDPFGWLLEKVDVTQWCGYCRAHRPWITRVWLAAASQLRAEHRLIHKAHGWGDRWEEFRQSEGKPKEPWFADSFYIALLIHAKEPRRSNLLNARGPQERLAQARQVGDEAFLRRFRRAKAGAGKRAGVSLAEDYAVQHWLELPLGLPGLCFFSDAALHSLVKIFRLPTGEGLATKQMRVRLGLIQAGARRHLVDDVIALGGKLCFQGSMMAKPFSFEGTVFWGRRQLWPQSY